MLTEVRPFQPKRADWQDVLAEVAEGIVDDAIEALHEEGRLTQESVKSADAVADARGGARIDSAAVRKVADAAATNLDWETDSDDRAALEHVARRRLSRYTDGQLEFQTDLAFVPSEFVDDRVSVEEGGARLLAHLADFARDAAAWRGRKTVATLRQSRFDEPAPARALQITAGAGKTTALIATLAANKHLRAWIIIPRHDLGAQILRDLEAGGVTDALHFKGRGAKVDPSDRTADADRMCAKHETALALGESGIPVQPTLCRLDDGAECERYGACPFIGQFRRFAGDDKETASPRIVITTIYNLQHRTLAKAFGEPELLFIDESLSIPSNERRLHIAEASALVNDLFDQAEERRKRARTYGRRAVVAIHREADDITAAANAARLVADIIHAVGTGYVTRAAVDEAGLDLDPAAVIRGVDIVRTVRLLPGSEPDPEALQADLTRASNLKAMECAAAELAAFMAGESEASGRLIVEADTLVHRPFEPIEETFRIPTMLFDATLPHRAVIERALGREVEILPAINVRWSECARLEYVIGASFGATAMGAVKGKDGGNRGLRAIEGARRLIHSKSVEFDRFPEHGSFPAPPDVAVFGQRAVLNRITHLGSSDEIDDFGADLTDKAPAFVTNANVVFGHYGALRGMNAYEGVRGVVAFGRLLPRPTIVEAMAARVTGVPVDPKLCGRWRKVRRQIPRSDGTATVVSHLEHPDPLCEAIRRAICEDELVQAVGRPRPLRRMEDTPLTVCIVGNVPLGIPADEVIRWRDIEKPAAAWALAGGVVPLTAADALAVGIVKTRKDARTFVDGARKMVDQLGARVVLIYRPDGSVLPVAINAGVWSSGPKFMARWLRRWTGEICLWGFGACRVGRDLDAEINLHRVLALLGGSGEDGHTAREIARKLRMPREDVDGHLREWERAGRVRKEIRRPPRGPASEIWLLGKPVTEMARSA